MGSTSLSREEKESRLNAIETLMVRRLTVSAISAWARKEFKIGARQVKDYIRAVRDRWAIEAGADVPAHRVEKRIHLDASLNDLYARAMARTEIVRDAAGNPMMIADEKGRHVPLTVERPDLRTAARVAESLCRLHGLYQDRIQHTGRDGQPLPPTQVNVMFVNRTREELLFFARRGFFPDRDEPAQIAATVISSTTTG